MKPSVTRSPVLDGHSATFVWYGKRAPLLIGDFTDWEDGKPVRLKRRAPEMWTYRLELPADAYIEYAYVENDERFDDPLNPKITPNGYGKLNHYFYMPAARPTSLARKMKNVSAGTVTSHVIRDEDLIVGGERQVYLYRPAETGPTPLLVVLDGPDYLHRASLARIVDNLAAQKHIRPISMAMVANAGQAREVEYSCSESTVRFINNDIIPLARQHLDLIDLQAAPGAYGILGASLGGLIAFYTACRLPHVFGSCLSQSGAFWLDEFESVAFDLIRNGPPRPLKIWLDAGLFDAIPLLQANQEMYAALSSRGYDARYREFPAGHNYTAWRDDIWRGLEYIFGVSQ
jgi:enterochelin esterase family protein